MKKAISIGIIALFIITAVSPMVIGFKSDAVNEIAEIVEPESAELSGPMDSAWPMYCHDARHTGRSPYSTIDNSGNEKWRFGTNGWATSSPVIDSGGTIYIGAHDFYAIHPNGTLKWEYHTDGAIESGAAIDENGIIYVGNAHTSYKRLYAFYPNGTLKWKFATGANIFSSPVIGADGTIFFGDDSHQIKALYPNGTLKWKYKTGHVIYSSPAIGLDNTVYCGSHDDYIYALYPNNGTLKWKFKTGGWVHGSPSVGDDGTIYIGSDDGYLYALYPNNGSLKWKCDIGRIHASPALDDDGVLYVGVWEKRFYAIYPNGTIKWSFHTNDKVWGSSAAISDDGTIYFGTCDLETSGGKDFIALNPDGTLKWRRTIGTLFSSPAIGEDCIVYIGTSTSENGYLYAFGRGELEADANGPYYGLINEPVQFTGSAQGGYSPHTWHWDFGDTYTSDEQNPTHIYSSPGNYTVTLTVTDDTGNTSDDASWAKIKESNNPPDKPAITGETNGKAGTKYNYVFVSTDSDGDEWFWYYIDWDDGSFEDWIGPYKPGEAVTVGHTWSPKGTYIIRAKARDNYGGESEWGTLEVTMPKNQQSQNMWYLQWLERFPILNQIVNLLMEKWI